MTDGARDRPELALGTANWGGRYGAPGREASVDEQTARGLAEVFLGAGHDLVDTAPAYGDAEELVGTVLAGRARVVSKVPAGLMVEADAARLAVDGLRRSLERTAVARFAGVLLHDASAAGRADGRGREVVDAVRSADLTDRVGVSVYAPEEATAAVERLGADLVQLPLNVLDQRFLDSGCLADLVGRGVEVHVRSVFLNGVVLADPDGLAGPLEALAPAVRRLRDAAEAAGTTPLELATAFARQATGAHAVLVGAFAVPQLTEVLAAWDRARHAPVDDAHWAALSASGVPAVDPRTWSG